MKFPETEKFTSEELVRGYRGAEVQAPGKSMVEDPTQEELESNIDLGGAARETVVPVVKNPFAPTPLLQNADYKPVM